MIKYLKVFATPKEIEQMKSAVQMPYLIIGEHCSESPQVMCHRFALLHKLPEVKGFYGCNLRTGEFSIEED